VIREWVRRAKSMEVDAHRILGVHEASRSRVVLLEDSYRRLRKLSLQQDELLRQALRCTENSLFRAAHVMAWAGFMDFLEEKLSSDGLKKLRAIRPKWKAATIEELRENVVEYQIIEAARDLKLCNKTEAKGLLGLLNKRNECAHPSGYFPLLNESLGYISEILQRIEQIGSHKI